MKRYKRTPEGRDEAIKRDNGLCVLCGDYASDVHHYKSRGSGGCDMPHNLVCLCRKCHEDVHRHDSDGELDARLVEYLEDYYNNPPQLWILGDLYV